MCVNQKSWFRWKKHSGSTVEVEIILKDQIVIDTGKYSKQQVIISSNALND